MQDVGRDEAHWCVMLTRQIQRLGGSPSHKTGAFFAKAIAISDPLERLVFLNRGQSWVVRKLAKLLPRIRDDALHADLRSEEHTSELQSLMRISYAVFCLKKKNQHHLHTQHIH